MFAVLTVQVQVEDDLELQDRIEKLEEMGYNVTVEYEAEDDDVEPIVEDLDDVEFDEGENENA